MAKFYSKLKFTFRKKYYLSRKNAVPKFATSCSGETLCNMPKEPIMKQTIILLFLLFTSLISAQNTEIDSVISEQILVMKESKINEFFIIEKYCDGCVLHNKKQQKCNYKDSDLYIFWKEENNSYFRKINKCEYLKVKISAGIFDSFNTKIEKIKTESVKSYQINQKTIGGCNNTTYAKYYFMVNGKLETKIFDYYSLTTQSEIPNINYDYNNALEIIKLDKVCEKIIRKNR